MTYDELIKEIKSNTETSENEMAIISAVDAYLSASNGAKPSVKCWCFLCHIELVEENDKLEMHGETVCQQCWDDNMYMALQDSGGC